MTRKRKTGSRGQTGPLEGPWAQQACRVPPRPRLLPAVSPGGGVGLAFLPRQTRSPMSAAGQAGPPSPVCPPVPWSSDLVLRASSSGLSPSPRADFMVFSTVSGRRRGLGA